MPLLLLALASCGAEAANPAQPEVEAPAVPSAPGRAELILAADRRTLSDAILSGLQSSDAAVRSESMLALARLHTPEAVDRLLLGLRDTDPNVRSAAALGLGALEEEAPQLAADALLAAIAAEPERELRAQMTRDLGRLRREEGIPAIAEALRSDDEAEQAAGCAAAGEMGLAGRDVPPEIRSRLAALIGPEQPERTRLACAYALARLPGPRSEASSGEMVALTVAATDPEPEVRTFAYRALARHPVALPVLVHGTRDDDWRVAVQAFRSLATRAGQVTGGAAVYAQALRHAHARFAEQPGPGPRLHVLSTALQAAAPIARSGPVHDAAAAIHDALGALPPGEPPTRERGLAHCAAAELLDRARGWPSRIEGCGLEQVLPRERLARSAVILGDLEGAEEQRLARLARLARHEQPIVRQSALSALARLWDPGATDRVLAALTTDDPGVLTAALDALATIARRAPTDARVPPPLPADRAVDALRAARAALGEGELEGLVSWLDAAEAVSARELASEVSRLALHPSFAPRSRARALLAAWGEPAPEEPVAPAPPSVEPEAILPPDARPRVRLETDRGVLVLELRPDQAPVTVARFLALVEGGFYDGLTFHRVVPGFVAQGGDPRGDGYGGPGFWLRCEDNRLPYVRGTVGMALAGRDTGGSQLFITAAAQPHLEGRYTAFGRVVEGLAHLDRLHPGDRIRRATADTTAR